MKKVLVLLVLLLLAIITITANMTPEGTHIYTCDMPAQSGVTYQDSSTCQAHIQAYWNTPAWNDTHAHIGGMHKSTR